MPINLKDTIAGLNDALYPGPNSVNATRLGVFGGESSGFARGVEELYSNGFYGVKVDPDGFTVAKGQGAIPRSIFNQYALFNFKGMYGSLAGDVAADYKDSPSNSLMGGDDSRSVSVGSLVGTFSERYPKIAYTPSNFLYAKYYKKIPINHLITLRRFPTPVQDNIFETNARPASKDPDTPPGDPVDTTQTAGVTAITYMGETAGNKIDDILKFTYGLTWKEVTSEMESISSGDGGYTQQPFYSKIGGMGRATADALKGVSSGAKFRRANNETGDKLGTTYANFVIGPVNVVNKTNIRDRGINFANDITLNFEYELKSLSYVNPKIAMIDIMSNMLTMTTNNAQFFGGGHRYYGGGGYVASQFGDISKLKNGDFAGYIGSVVSDVETGFKQVFGGGTGEFNFENGLEGLLQVGKTMLGNALGGFLSDNVGAVSGTQATKAFVSAEPTGDWHITVGNPFNPIVMMGNMYCDSSIMTLGQGLGYDDFPMEVKFEVSLKHGKPRDKGDIENMFNAGKGRIYASAAGEDDILNLRGLDVKTYGSVQNVGTVNLQNTQSGSVTNGTSPTDVNNSNVSNIKKSGSSSTETGEYVSNIVSMIIDS
jgi:hypothetical protein